MKAKYVGNCSSNPFETVAFFNNVIAKGKEITKDEFIINAEYTGFIYDMGEPDIMDKYPYDFKFFIYKEGKRTIYYFTHSATEFFYE